jgi:predicted PurR-regulated permease PerM
MIVILSVIAFADALGIGGVLIAIPVVALVRKLWLAVIPFYLGSVAYDLDTDNPIEAKKN